MNASGRPLPQWAREATLGIFVHWGPYSVPAWAEPSGALGAVPDDEWFAHNAYAEWYANTIRLEGSPAAEHHARVHGGRVEDAALTLSPRELARHWADVVSRGGRLLLNVGPEASGRLPDVQRRTLEGVAPWLTAIKPFTLDRTMLADGEVEVTDAAWWRAWAVPGGVVAVVDGPAASVLARDGRAVATFALPG